jgi:hypothetical protein
MEPLLLATVITDFKQNLVGTLKTGINEEILRTHTPMPKNYQRDITESVAAFIRGFGCAGSNQIDIFMFSEFRS